MHSVITKTSGIIQIPRLARSTHAQKGAGWPYPIYMSDSIRDRKSVFLAHASTLESPSALPVFLTHLSALPQLKRATHCMYAYQTSGDAISGQNDGGESGSGERLARLLRLTGSHDTVLVVSRWYGGIQLGSDRWKHISDVAKDALEKGGFMEDREKPQGKSSKKSKKKKK